MTAEQYLSRHESLYNEILAHKENIDKLVSNRNSYLIAEQINKEKKDMKEATEKIKMIKDIINSIPNMNQRDALTYYYIEHKKTHEIENTMHYSERSVLRFRQNGLKYLDENVKQFLI
jgi:DNA-directed RNA polymerase specialized sigma subunit